MSTWFRLLIFFALAAFGSTIFGCKGGTADAPAETKSSSSSEPEVASTAPKGPVTIPDAGEVPEGDSEELLAFINRLSEMEPVGDNEADRSDSIRKIVLTQLQAAENMLGKEIKPAEQLAALEVKANALRTLATIDPDGVGEGFDPFLDELIKSDVSEHVRLADISRVQYELDQLANEQIKDPAIVIDKLKELIKQDGAGMRVLLTTKNAARTLRSLGFQNEASNVMQLAADVFKDHRDDVVAAQAKTLVQESTLLEIDSKVLGVLAGKPNANAELKDAIKQLLSNDELGQEELSLVAQTAQSLEFENQLPIAKSIYRMLAEAYATNADQALATQAKSTVSMASRRFKLLGNKLDLEGVLHDGSKFNWQAFRGKVVLVDFWATYCPTCRGELANIRRAYSQFNDQGFEVVGISLDEDISQLRNYLKREPLPWPVVISSRAGANGLSNPNAKKCGVEAIPMTLLVDGDGNVRSLHVLGFRLAEEVEKLLAEKQAQTKNRFQTRFVSLQVATDEKEAEPIDAESKDTKPKDAGANDQGASDPNAESTESEDKSDELEELATRNPYAPREGMSPQELIEFIFDLEDRPKSIQMRDGFTAGLVEAANQVVASNAKERFKTVAILSQSKFLHRDASLGEEDADKQLREWVKRWDGDQRKKVQSELTFLKTEQKVIESESLEPPAMKALFDELRKYYSKNELDNRHLRMASSTVAAINRIDDGDEREKLFEEFGELWSSSDDKQLAKYGKRIAGKSAAPVSDLVGKPIELDGQTTTGEQFDWKSYRGKYVLVDFWATWCGPCIRSIPKLRKMVKDHHIKDFDVVGISLDEDIDALSGFLEKNELPWTILAGEGTQELGKTYGVRGIPMLILVDREGKAIKVSHSADEIASELSKLLDS